MKAKRSFAQIATLKNLRQFVLQNVLFVGIGLSCGALYANYMLG